MLLRLTVYDVAESTATDASLGLYLGDLRFGYGYTSSNYKAGFIDNASFSGLTQSAANITSGGTYASGFSGLVQIRVTSQELFEAWQAQEITLNGRYCKLEVYFGSWSTIFYQKITAIEPVDRLSLNLVINSAAALDTVKLPLVTVTREMALNVDSDAVGQVVTPVYGKHVFYKMIFCESPDTIATLVSNYMMDGVTEVLQANAQPLGTSTLFEQLATPDLTFMRGKSMLQCVGLWQPSATEQVWLALSYNGKDLLATTNAQSYIVRMRRALVGKRMRCTHGSGKDSVVSVTDVKWATHDTYWGNISLQTVWIQLDTSDIEQFSQALPNFVFGEAEANGNQPLNISDLPGVNVYASLQELVGPLKDDKFDTSISYFSFEQAYAGLFIVPAEAEVDGATIVQPSTAPEGYVIVATPTINTIYTSDKWKLLSIELLTSTDNEASTFQQLTDVEVDTYMLSTETVGPYSYLNSFGYTPESGGSGAIVDSGTYAKPLQLVSQAGDTYANGVVEAYVVDGYSLNTFYVPAAASLFAEKADLCIIPDLKVQFTRANCAYTGTIFVDIYAIGENNIAILKKSFSADYAFDASGLSLPNEFIHIDPTTRTIKFSANCSSHGESSSALYKALESSVLLSESDITAFKNILNGFVISVKFAYYRAALNGLSVQGLYKTLKPARTYFTRSANKQDLWLQTVRSASNAQAPVDIIRELAETLGVPVDDTSFTAVSNAQADYQTDATNYDGIYTPDPDESFSDIVDKICKGSLTAVYADAVGTLKAAFLPLTPATVSYVFEADSIIQGSDKYSAPSNGFVYTDFDFSYALNPIAPKQTVTLDTDATVFPDEDDYKLGDFTFSSATGFTVQKINDSVIGDLDYLAIRVRGTSDALFALFVPGSRWSFRTSHGGSIFRRYVLRLDNVAHEVVNPDPNGILLLFFIESFEAITTDYDNVLTTFGPNPKWRELVSGALVENYPLAASLWGYAKTARDLIGTEIKAPTNITELTQPIWSSDTVAITKWITETVRYCTKSKFLIRFTAHYNTFTKHVQYMDYITYAFGAFLGTPVSGYVVERSLNLEKAEMTLTMLCIGDTLNSPVVLTEMDDAIELEAGPLLEPEDTSTSVKISEMVAISAEAAANAGAYTVVAIPNITNQRVAMSSIYNWILEDAIDAAEALIAGITISHNATMVGDGTNAVPLGVNPAYITQELTRTRVKHGVPMTAGINKESLWSSVTGHTWATRNYSFNGGVYVEGALSNLNTSVTYTNTLGLKFIYADTNANLTASDSAWDIFTHVPITLLFHDPDDEANSDELEERHGADRNRAWHYTKHFEADGGTKVDSVDRPIISGITQGGETPTSPTTDGNRGSWTAHDIFDEDIRFRVAAQAEGSYTVLYYTGVKPQHTFGNANMFPLGTTYPQYNNPASGLVESSNLRYVVYFHYSKPSKRGGTYQNVIIPAQKDFASYAEAAAYYPSDMNLNWMPSQEYVAWGRTIYRCFVSYSSAGKVGLCKFDYLYGSRNSVGGGSGSGTSDHNLLTNRDLAGQHPGTAVTNTPAGTLVATTVQAAINELDTKKVAANAPITAGTATKITFDAKGLVTGGSALAESDIPALSISKITGLQAALDGKASLAGAAFTGLTYVRKASGTSEFYVYSPDGTDWVRFQAASDDVRWETVVGTSGISAVVLPSGSLLRVNAGTSLLDITQDNITRQVGAVNSDVVWSTDPRLTDARPPTAHTQDWSTITGKPTTFTPNAHASTHSVGGSDVLGDVVFNNIAGAGLSAYAGVAAFGHKDWYKQGSHFGFLQDGTSNVTIAGKSVNVTVGSANELLYLRGGTKIYLSPDVVSNASKILELGVDTTGIQLYSFERTTSTWRTLQIAGSNVDIYPTLGKLTFGNADRLENAVMFGSGTASTYGNVYYDSTIQGIQFSGGLYGASYVRAGTHFESSDATNAFYHRGKFNFLNATANGWIIWATPQAATNKLGLSNIYSISASGDITTTANMACAIMYYPTGTRTDDFNANGVFRVRRNDSEKGIELIADVSGTSYLLSYTRSGSVGYNPLRLDASLVTVGPTDTQLVVTGMATVRSLCLSFEAYDVSNPLVLNSSRRGVIVLGDGTGPTGTLSGGTPGQLFTFTSSNSTSRSVTFTRPDGSTTSRSCTNASCFTLLCVSTDRYVVFSPT